MACSFSIGAIRKAKSQARIECAGHSLPTRSGTILKTLIALYFLGVLSIFPIVAHSQTITAPTLSPPSGAAFVDDTPITVTDTASAITIHYTTDGVNPTQNDSSITSGSSINIGAAVILKACAFDGSGNPSAVTSGTYQITGLIDGGSYHGIAIDFSGKLWAWGAQGMGRLGNGSTTTGVNVLTPGRVEFSSTATFDNAISASAGNGHSLAVDSSGKVWAFGGNADYQLGNNTTTDSAYAIPVLTGTGSSQYLTGMTDVSASFDFSFATGTSGGVWAWGDNTSGRTGVGTTAGNQKFAAPVLSTTGTLGNIVEVASSGVFGLALDGTGAVWAWGDNTDGPIGVSGSTSQTKAVKVVWTGTGTPFNGVTDIAAGWEHGMAVVWNGSNSGTVWCWGEQANGRLGNGQNAAAVIKTPVEVTCTNGATLTNIVQIAAGPRHSLALDGTGGVWAWGYNATGDLGNGTTTTGLNAAPVSLPEAMLTIGAGGYDDGSGTIQAFSYAIGVSGKFYAWGYDGHGELADGQTVNLDGPEVTGTSVNWLDSFALQNPLGWSGVAIQPANITLTPTATAGALAKAEFFGNSSYLGTTTTSPFTWSLSNLSAGSYTFSVVGMDAYGASASSSLSLGIPLPTITGNVIVPNVTMTGGSSGDFQLSRNGSTTNPVTFTYTVGGTAVSGSNYVALSGSATIPSGSSFTDIYVTPIPARDFSWQTRDVSISVSLTGSGYNLQSGTADIILTNLPPLATPTLGPAAGGVMFVPDVSLSDTDTNADTIYYTTDGSTPTTGSPLVAPGQTVRIAPNTVVNAIAYGEGYPYSLITTGTYSGIAQISAGSTHSLAVKTDGSLWGWGSNATGQLGNGNKLDQWYPMPLGITSGTTLVVSISAGGGHSLAVTSDGKLWAWGDNTYGQTGVSSTGTDILTPSLVSTGGTTIVAVAAGGMHSLALTSGSTVLAFGYNANGQLGNSGTTSSYTPVVVTGLSNIVAIAAGYDFSAALTDDGTIWTWGDNAEGACGISTGVNITTPTQVTGFLGVTAIAAGYDHMLALKNDSTLWAWGSNSRGQEGSPLGSGYEAVQVALAFSSYLTNVVSVSAGTTYSIALRNDGSIWGWGDNQNGELGISGSSEVIFASEVSGTSNGQVASAGQHTLIGNADGTITCFGLNSHGQLAVGSTNNISMPLTSDAVVALQPPQPSFSPDSGNYSVSQTVTVSCTDSLATVMYTTDGSLPSLTATDSFAITSGDNVTISGPEILRARAFHAGILPGPVKSAAYHMGYQMLASVGHSILLDGSGNVYTWGSNESYPSNSSASGVLGLGWNADDQVYPQFVSGVPGPGLSIGTGPNNCAVVIKSGTAAGTIWGWGDNTYNQLGLWNSGSLSGTAVQVSGSGTIVAVSCGLEHMVGLTSSGSVITWGGDGYGQLGNGTTEYSASAATVPGVSNIKAVAAGDYHTVALTGSGTVLAWGYNNLGQLGYSTSPNNYGATPATVAGLTGIIAISVAGSHNFALKSDGTVWAWGEDSNDLLGDTLNTQENSPICVGTIRDVAAIATGIDHTVAIHGDNIIYAWGSNSGDSLGVSLTGSSTPVAMSAFGLSQSGTNYVSALTSVTAGYHSLAVMTTDGAQTLWGWGQNANGELGDGTLNSRYTPAMVQFTGYADTNHDGLPDWLAVELGLNPGTNNPGGIPYGLLYSNGVTTQGLTETLPYTPYQLPAGNPNDHTSPTIYVTIPAGATLQ
jgi:alpha-tubulin suppressor-like RCC1 family protein